MNPAPAPAPVAAARPVEPTVAPPRERAAPGMQWHGDIQWLGWSDGLARARKESKPIFLLVYADWCPHCRALGAVFEDPEVAKLAARFVMVRQNHDDAPAWLEPYTQKYGGYVPRIFFFDSNGKLREDVKSGHPRFPYFYAAEQPDFLKQAMRRVTSS